MFYRWLIRPILYRLPPEMAHRITFGLLRAVAMLPGVRTLLRHVCQREDPVLRSVVFGREFPNPVGLAAGFDKDGMGFDALGALGFGFVEIGTLTGEPQPGNESPRLFRLPRDRALINRMGFNNQGSLAVVPRLSRPRTTMVGVNIGKTKRVPEAEAVADYVKSATRLAAYADYMVVNVSSPNTPGLRNLQAVDKLEPLLRSVQNVLREHGREVPLCVKIAPDLSDSDIDAVADLALQLSLSGIIATNTTIRRDGLRTNDRRVRQIGMGGLSGPPVHDRSLAVLRRLRQRVGERLVLISVGGIETSDQAWDRICAGASLVQVYTGLIDQGPMLPRRLNAGLIQHCRQAGLTSIHEAIGCSVSTPS